MKVKYFIIYWLALITFKIPCLSQSGWEVYAGYSRSNLNDYLLGQNRVFIYPINSPNYLNTFHFGVNKTLLQKHNHYFQIGLGIFGRGSKDYSHIIFPVDTVIVHQLYYAALPIQANLKLLNSKDVFFTLGMSPSYLLIQTKFDGLRIFPKANYFQMDYNLGFRAKIYDNFDLKVCYSQGLINVSNRDSSVEYLKTKILNHSFDFSIIYKL